VVAWPPPAGPGGRDAGLVWPGAYPDPYTRLRDYGEPTELSPAYDSDSVDAFYRAQRDERLPQMVATPTVDPEARLLVGQST
jgi:hypothetical protein